MGEKRVIQPTVGRVVLYYPGGKAEKESGAQPRAAQVAHVHSDRMLNIGYLTTAGQHASETSVALRQPDDETPEHGFCEWMEYQVSQAAK